MRLTIRQLLALLAVLSVATAHAQTPTVDAGTIDQNFLVAAAQANNAEILQSQIAAAKATRRDVRAYAERMVAHHSEAAATLATLASSKQVSLPTTPDPAHSVALAALGQMSDRAITRGYPLQMVLDHQLAVQLFQYEVDRGADPEIKSFARSLLPRLKNHLQSATSLYLKVRRSAGSKTK